MKKFVLFAMALSLASTCLCQSLLNQSNEKSAGIKQKIETLQIDLSNKLNTIQKSISNFQLRDKVTTFDTANVNANILNISNSLDASKTKMMTYFIANDSLNNDIKDKQFQISKTNKIKNLGYKTKVANLNDQIKNLKQQAQANDSLIDEVKKKQNGLEEELKSKTSKLASQVFEKFQDQETILSLNINKHQTLINTLNDQFLQLQNAKTIIDSSFAKKNWIEHKLISDDDQGKIIVLIQEMTLALDISERAIDALEDPLKNFGNVIDTLTTKKDKIALLLSFGDVPAFIETIKKEISVVNDYLAILEEREDKIRKDATKSSQILKEAQALLIKKQDEIAGIYKLYKNEADTSAGDLRTTASISQALGGQSQIVPSISVLGFNTKKSSSSSVSTQLKLFVSSNTQEKNVVTGNNKLFIPEASTFGFMADFAFGFIPSTTPISRGPGNEPYKKLAINLGGYYLGKSLVSEKDTTNFNIGMVQFKAGMQYIVIGNLLSVYANVNPFFISSGVKDYEENFSNVKKLKAYVDFGLDCYLRLSKEPTNGLFIDLDLGFISRGGDVKSVVTSNDLLIPKIKLGIVKAFAF